MFKVTLRGSHYEIGFQHGVILKKAGIRFPRPSNKAIQFAHRVEQEIASLVPEIIDEIHGFAEGSTQAYEVVRTIALTLGNSPGCTVFAIPGHSTAAGKTVFARNYDGTPDFQNFVLFKTYPGNHLSHIGCCFDMIVGREDGINEAGVAIAVTGVHGRYTSQPGVWDHIPVRAVLDQCTSTNDAVSLLNQFPHLFAKNFLVADATGTIAIVEAAQQAISVHYPQDDVGVTTNHFVSPFMQAYNNPDRIMPRTYQRHATVLNWFSQQIKPIRLRQVKHLLKHSEHGVCSNTTDSHTSKPFITVWSWVTELGTRHFELATGTPISSGSKYRKYTF